MDAVEVPNCSVSDPDLFHFAKKSAKIMANSHKNQSKSQEYHVFYIYI